MSEAEELLKKKLRIATFIIASDGSTQTTKAIRDYEAEELILVARKEVEKEWSTRDLMDFNKVCAENIEEAKKEVEARVKKEVSDAFLPEQGKRAKEIVVLKIELKKLSRMLPINWRGNKEVVELVRSEKRETAKEIDGIIVNHAFCRKPHDKLVRDGSGMRNATCLDMIHMETKKRFLPKPSGSEKK